MAKTANKGDAAGAAPKTKKLPQKKVRVRNQVKRGPHGGFTWKADPHMRLGSPGPFSDETLRAQYARTQRPVMALSGTEEDQWSFLQPEDRARRLAAFPDSEHHPVPDAGHYIHVEQPDQTIRLMDAFFHG